MFSDRLIAFCIAGHCDNSRKLKQAVDIIQTIKEKYPNELISYCSHIPVDPIIQELTHYSYYDSHNIISNVNYTDDLSSLYKQIFWHVPQNGYHLIKKIPHQCYAHHLNWYTQSKILVDKKLDHIFYLNTDCDYNIFDVIDRHIFLHREGLDAVFYNFFVGQEEINGEFFSMTKKGMEQIILSMSTQSDFYSYGTWSFEQCYFRVARHNNIRFHFEGVWPHNDGIIGNNIYGKTEGEVDGVRILNATNIKVHIIPFLDYLDNYTLKIASLVANQPEDFKKCTIKIFFFDDHNNKSEVFHSFVLANNGYNICVPPSGFPIVKVYRAGKFVLSFDLRDKRNIGDMIEDKELPNYNLNLKG